LDGRIARLTNTESDFGREFDSLADALTFGAAPALLAYVWGLDEIGRLGWIVPLFYLVCTATRLARFNVQSRVADKRFFVGLPAPAAACSVASFLYFAPGSEWGLWTRIVLMMAFGILAGLMISTFRYPSFKQIDLKQRWSYRTALPLALVLLVVAYHPPAFFLTVAIVYTSSAPIAWVFGRTANLTPPPEAEAKGGTRP
jgi:CDP-diacylglycerol--serine O-phosphatidyltransferase